MESRRHGGGRRALLIATSAALLVAGVPAVQAYHGGGTSGGSSGETTITATKTAYPFWYRVVEYDWTVEKTVEPSSVEIGPGESATVTYWINATRTKVSESETRGVKGRICVTNTGSASTQGLSIVDQVQYRTGADPFRDLAGASQTIVPSSQVGPGATRCFSYSIAFEPVSGATYRNVARVTITNHVGYAGQPFGPSPAVDFSLPASPRTQAVDSTAGVVDVQTCPAGFTCTPSDAGPWFFRNSGSVHFTKELTNVSAECGQELELLNTVTLTEYKTKQQRTASARVVVSTGECPEEAQGCTPGYWKNHPDAWGPTGFSTGQAVGGVFSGVDPSLSGSSLLGALSFQGGSTIVGAQEILLRAAVAALLNAAHPDVSYPRSPAQVVAEVNAALATASRDAILALASALDADNNAGCPLS